jgi:type IV pilus assembly protein PilP
MRFSTARKFGTCLLLITAAACGDDAPGASAPKAAAQAPKKADTVAAVKPPEPTTAQIEYLYNPVAKRDPFRGLRVETAPDEAGGTEGSVCSEPLCQQDIDEFSLVAVVSGDANPMGMVEDKNGVGHLVRRNSKIGRQGGKVTQVLRDCIIVTSFVRGPDNRDVATKTNMCVKTDVRTAPVLNLMDGKLRQ